VTIRLSLTPADGVSTWIFRSLLLLYSTMEAASYSECWQLCTNTHGIIFQKNGSFSTTAVRTSNLGN